MGTVVAIIIFAAIVWGIGAFIAIKIGDSAGKASTNRKVARYEGILANGAHNNSKDMNQSTSAQSSKLAGESIAKNSSSLKSAIANCASSSTKNQGITSAKHRLSALIDSMEPLVDTSSLASALSSKQRSESWFDGDAAEAAGVTIQILYQIIAIEDIPDSAKMGLQLVFAKRYDFTAAELDRVGEKAADCINPAGDDMDAGMITGQIALDLFWDMYNHFANKEHQAPSKKARDEDSSINGQIDNLRLMSFDLVLGLVAIENMVEMVKIGRLGWSQDESDIRKDSGGIIKLNDGSLFVPRSEYSMSPNPVYDQRIFFSEQFTGYEKVSQSLLDKEINGREYTCDQIELMNADDKNDKVTLYFELPKEYLEIIGMTK